MEHYPINALTEALHRWRAILGPEKVSTDTAARRTAETATFATRQRIPAILYPGSRQEVQDCLKTAHQYRLPVYTVSQGKNWGLGSRVPVRDQCVLMDLGGLNRIVDYNEELSYLTVEPGVTFRQASDYLRSRNSPLFLSVIGGHPEASLIGNALERGDGVGPLGERIAQACALEVILPDGELLSTGFQRFGDSPVANISRWGVGPSLDGLFSQSNLGIVTRMTFWLMQKPAWFQAFLFTVKKGRTLEELIDALGPLYSRGVLQGNSLAVWNGFKMLASEAQYPWQLTGGLTPLPNGTLQGLKNPWGQCDWIGVGGLYGASREHGLADRKLIRKSLGRIADRLLFIDSRRARLIQTLQKPLSLLTGTDVGEVVRRLYFESIFLGFPTERSTRSLYWRKKEPRPADMNPDRDACGVIWLCPVVPFSGRHLDRATGLITEIFQKHGFEPQIAFMFPSERAAYVFPSIVYDRNIPGEDERAMACHDHLLAAMIREGYFPYRLGIHSMASLPPSQEGYDRVLEKIRRTLDANNILNPGRYAPPEGPPPVRSIGCPPQASRAAAAVSQ